MYPMFAFYTISWLQDVTRATIGCEKLGDPVQTATLEWVGSPSVLMTIGRALYDFYEEVLG